MNTLLLTIFIVLLTVCSADVATKAVVVMTGPYGVNGTIVFQQDSPDAPVRITGSIVGLAPNALRGFHIHQYGNLTEGCTSTGSHFNPYGMNHGAPTDSVRHLGDLGNIQTDANGVATINFTDSVISLNGANCIVGRGLTVHNGTDDLGKGNNPDSLLTGNSGGRLACGVIGFA